MVGPKRHPEHIGDDLLRHTLILQLLSEIGEDAVGDVRQRRAHATAGGKLGDQHHGLLDDGIDEQVGIHAGLPSKPKVSANSRLDASAEADTRPKLRARAPDRRRKSALPKLALLSCAPPHLHWWMPEFLWLFRERLAKACSLGFKRG
jgi:hypothetical protein